MTKGVIISRRVMMDLAKCIRNQDKVHYEHRLLIGKAIADYMICEYPMFDRAVFLQILTGDLAYDPKTEAYTKIPTKFGDKL
jgi:hypothetical protein